MTEIRTIVTWDGGRSWWAVQVWENFRGVLDTIPFSLMVVGFMDVCTWQGLPHRILLRISAHSVLLRNDWYSFPFPFSFNPRSSLSLMHCSPLLSCFLQAFKYCQLSQRAPESLANVSPALIVLAPFLLQEYNLDTHCRLSGSSIWLLSWICYNYFVCYVNAKK